MGLFKSAASTVFLSVNLLCLTSLLVSRRNLSTVFDAHRSDSIEIVRNVYGGEQHEQQQQRSSRS